jgi:hypothetical protein
LTDRSDDSNVCSLRLALAAIAAVPVADDVDDHDHGSVERVAEADAAQGTSGRRVKIWIAFTALQPNRRSSEVERNVHWITPSCRERSSSTTNGSAGKPSAIQTQAPPDRRRGLLVTAENPGV